MLIGINPIKRRAASSLKNSCISRQEKGYSFLSAIGKEVQDTLTAIMRPALIFRGSASKFSPIESVNYPISGAFTVERRASRMGNHLRTSRIISFLASFGFLRMLGNPFSSPSVTCLKTLFFVGKSVAPLSFAFHNLRTHEVSHF